MQHVSLIFIFIATLLISACGGTGSAGSAGSTGASANISATSNTSAQSLTVGTAMVSFQPLIASGGATPYTYSYTGTLPAGLNFNASSGAVTGTPTAVYANANLVFSVKDVNNVVATTTSTVSFNVIAAIVLPAGYVSQGGLTWMPVSSTKYYSYGANTLCAGAINGQTGWRLPNKAELVALYASGAMNGQGWSLDLTWASDYSGYNEFYIVNLYNGNVRSSGFIDILPMPTYYVSCVR